MRIQMHENPKSKSWELKEAQDAYDSSMFVFRNVSQGYRLAAMEYRLGEIEFDEFEKARLSLNDAQKAVDICETKLINNNTNQIKL